MSKNSPERATDAHVSLIGHITQTELCRRLDDTEYANGFANRFLFVCVRRSKFLPDGGRPIDWTDLQLKAKAALVKARTTGQMSFDAAAREKWRAVYRELSEGRPGMLGAVTARATAQVVRLSLIYALLDQADCIRLEHLQAALACWRYAEGLG